MPFNLKINYFVGFALFLVTQTAIAQKNIIISDSLKANAEELKVKIGAQGFGKVANLKFGDYAIVSSKMGWAKSVSTSNFFVTKTESKSTQKFSFVLAGNGIDSAHVDAATNTLLQSQNSFQVSKHFSLGNDELLKQSINFSAHISLNSDTGSVWILVMKEETGSQTAEKYQGFLTDGARRILIFPVSSDGMGKHSFSPALGYELIENGKSYCALQYSGGGMLPLNHNVIWLHKALDARTKLMLSAALSALLEFKFGEQVQMDR